MDAYTLALVGLIVSGVSACAAVATVIVAVFALEWARQAADETRRQADAAQEAVKAGLEATKAAQKQALLLEEQIQLMEARAILLLAYSTDGLEVDNVGNELAFDFQLCPIEYEIPALGTTTPQRRKLRFENLPLVRFGSSPKKLKFEIEPKSAQRIDSVGQRSSEFGEFIDLLASITSANAQNRGDDPKKRLVMTTLTGTYRNARNQLFHLAFDLTVTNQRTYECRISTSLLEQRTARPESNQT